MILIVFMFICLAFLTAIFVIIIDHLLGILLWWNQLLKSEIGIVDRLLDELLFDLNIRLFEGFHVVLELDFWVSVGYVGVLDFLFEGFEELLDCRFLDIAWTALILEAFTNVVLNDFLKWIFLFFIRDSTGIVLDLLHSWVVRWYFLSFG